MAGLRDSWLPCDAQRMKAILRRRKLPHVYDPLRVYASERARGIMHCPEWRERMAELQHDYDQWLEKEANR